MLTLFCVICTSAVTAALPLLVSLVARQVPAFKPRRPDPLWVYLAALLIVVSVLLPDIHISNQTQTFQQHFVGGGMYVACLFIYIKQLLNWRLHWTAEILVLFAWVSAFGVAVELLEFLATQVDIVHLANADTDWDLLANTLGAFCLFLLYSVYRTIETPKHK
jgi:uncharacterized membrane protein YidH (DUF202 family)